MIGPSKIRMYKLFLKSLQSMCRVRTQTNKFDINQFKLLKQNQLDKENKRSKKPQRSNLKTNKKSLDSRNNILMTQEILKNKI